MGSVQEPAKIAVNLLPELWKLVISQEGCSFAELLLLLLLSSSSSSSLFVRKYEVY
jgi:hypothetical protein